MEQRGTFVITSAGAFVTLLFALAALVTKPAGFVLTEGPKTALTVAVGLFFLTGILGLATNAPLFRYEEPDEEALKEIVRDPALSDTDDSVATQEVTLVRLKTVTSYRSKNTMKAWILASALLAEAVAIGFVAYSIMLILNETGTAP